MTSMPLLAILCYRAFLIQIIMITKEFKFKNGDENYYSINLLSKEEYIIESK